MGAHTDFMGPLLFVGGRIDGERRSVNATRDDWLIPYPVPVRSAYAEPEFMSVDDSPRPDRYLKRTLTLGHGTEVTVMVWEHTPGPEAYRLALGHIAALANGGDRA